MRLVNTEVLNSYANNKIISENSVASNNTKKYKNSGHKVTKIHLEGQTKILYDHNLKKSTHDNKINL